MKLKNSVKKEIVFRKLKAYSKELKGVRFDKIGIIYNKGRSSLSNAACVKLFDELFGGSI